MKYILYPFWVIICLGLVFLKLLIFVVFHILGFLWRFSFINLSWEMFTKEDDVYGFINPGYDKNPIETFIRYLTLGSYKNYKQ